MTKNEEHINNWLLSPVDLTVHWNDFPWIGMNIKKAYCVTIPKEKMNKTYEC